VNLLERGFNWKANPLVVRPISCFLYAAGFLFSGTAISSNLAASWRNVSGTLAPAMGLPCPGATIIGSSIAKRCTGREAKAESWRPGRLQDLVWDSPFARSGKDAQAGARTPERSILRPGHGRRLRGQNGRALERLRSAPLKFFSAQLRIIPAEKGIAESISVHEPLGCAIPKTLTNVMRRPCTRARLSPWGRSGLQEFLRNP